MKQAELNRQVAKQLGESICEIARRGKWVEIHL